jgi:hypothetical protein
MGHRNDEARAMRDQLLSFDSVELSELHRIYLEVCKELEVGPDQSRRDEVAAAVMHVAQGGGIDPGALHQRVMLLLMNR